MRLKCEFLSRTSPHQLYILYPSQAPLATPLHPTSPYPPKPPHKIMSVIQTRTPPDLPGVARKINLVYGNWFNQYPLTSLTGDITEYPICQVQADAVAGKPLDALLITLQ